jgi:hypothetical protein
MTVVPPHFTSPYPIGPPNEPIEISQEGLALVSDNEWMLGTGSARLRFLPRPRLQIQGNFLSTRLHLGENAEERLGLPGRGLEVSGFSSSITEAGSSLALEWTVSPQRLVATGDETTVLSRVLFQVVNFLDFYSPHGTFETVAGTSHRIESLHLNWENLSIHIRSLPTTLMSVKMLRNQGGFAVMHIGELTFQNSETRPAKNIESILRALIFFLSFCRGAWSSPILPTGYDENGQLVWECWNSPQGESYADTHSWVEKLIGAEQMEAVFPGFMTLWSDDGWQDALIEALYWYLNSNYSPRGIDAGIILAQTAIERLCFTHSVEKNPYLSLDGFTKLSAADRYRLLFASLQIPQMIPPELTKMTKLAAAHSWKDAPQALTEIRNEKVHPQHKKRGMFDDALYEAWTLGLWYIEMVLLRLCGYTGRYVNRWNPSRSLGQVENVPWL